MLRKHSLCLQLLEKFKDGIKRQDKVNAIIKYINNDFSMSELERWRDLFIDGEIKLLDQNIIDDYIETIQGISISSDAFFPFRDNIDYASKYGVSYLIQPGGSIQDEGVIEACNEYGMTMALSGKRMFLH